MLKKIIFILALVASGFAGFYVAKIQTTMDNTLNLINRDVENQLSKVDLSGVQLSSDEEIVNILLVGVDERLEEHDEGRSDSTMIATLDKKHKRLKLTSLMRDMYLEIPGYGQTKFNSAYAFGGVQLLYETIAINFGIQLDGYAEVNFEAFTKVINEVGGVNIELSEREAEYLNTTNYISKKKYRNVKPGKNKLNGYQALGYARVRYVATPQGLKDDYGRTYRQRTVMQALFSKVKSMPMSQWLDLAQVVLPEVTTDLDNDMIISYMKDIIMMGTTEIDQMRIPTDNGFHDERINGMDVLVIDKEKNADVLQDFIFQSAGEKKE